MGRYSRFAASWARARKKGPQVPIDPNLPINPAPEPTDPATPTPVVTDFDTWTAKTIPPQNDWVAAASLKGNPNFNQGALSTEMQGYIDKAYFFHRRLQLAEGQTLTIPGTTTNVGFISADMPGGFGINYSGNRSWKKAFQDGMGGEMLHVRYHNRNSGYFWDNALNFFMLTHDLRWLEIANWWFDQYWDACMRFADARESWSNGKVTTTKNVNGRGYPAKDWLPRYCGPVQMRDAGITTLEAQLAEAKDINNWSKTYYRGFGIVGSLGHIKESRTNPIRRTSSYEEFLDGKLQHKASKHNFLGLPNNNDSANKVDTNWNMDAPMEDCLLHGVIAKHMRALYANRTITSTPIRNYNYNQWHERARHYMYENFVPKWKDVNTRPAFSQFGEAGHPLIHYQLSHPFNQQLRMYYHLWHYANETGRADAGDYLNALEFLGEGAAKDVMWVNLAQPVGSPATDRSGGETTPGLVYPHAAGMGGYYRSYEVDGPSWQSDKKVFNQSQERRRGNGVPKLVYMDQMFDAPLDMWLSRYLDHLPPTRRAVFRTRTSKTDATPGPYLYGEQWMRGVLNILTYQAANNVTDASTSKTWTNGITGYGNVFHDHKHEYAALGGSSGDTALWRLNNLIDRSLTYVLFFDDKQTGAGARKVRQAFMALKAQQNWNIGRNPNFIPNTFELFDSLLKKSI